MSINIAMYKYNLNQSSYIGMMIGFLQLRYNVIDYMKLKDGIYRLEDIDVIYVNWLEDVMSSEDCDLLKRAKNSGINIIWVFHNRIPHDSINENQAIKNAVFLTDISTNIIIHSRRSLMYLKEFNPNVDGSKIHYIPHPDFIDEYFVYESIRDRYAISNDNIVFSIIGSVRRYKNIELLIEVFRNIESNNCTLLIVGTYSDLEYINYIKGLVGDDSRIIIDVSNRLISSMEMKSYLDASDILVLPYNKRSSLNSGVMLMAFSYNKTVIVPDIAMADDFDDKLIYKYHYDSELDHAKQLKIAMENVIAAGKSKLEAQGRKLHDYTITHCSKELVKTKLYKIIDNNTKKRNCEMQSSFNTLYSLDTKLEASNYRASVALQLLDFQKHNGRLSPWLKYNNMKSVAIYGYGQIGKYIVKELECEGIAISYIIDRNADKFSGIEAYTLEEDIPMVDVVIVTASGVNCIKERLRQKGFKNIVAISDILDLRMEKKDD